jgi:hypothetical protein
MSRTRGRRPDARARNPMAIRMASLYGVPRLAARPGETSAHGLGRSELTTRGRGPDMSLHLTAATRVEPPSASENPAETLTGSCEPPVRSFLHVPKTLKSDIFLREFVDVKSQDSGWIRTSNPPVNRLTQVDYPVGSSWVLTQMGTCCYPVVGSELITD